MHAKWLSLIGLVALAGCGGSGGSSTPVNTKYDPTTYAATYSGNWNNLTYNTTGGSIIQTTIDTTKKTIAFKTTLSGKVFGGNAPPPFTVNGTYTTAGATFAENIPLEGDLKVSIDPNGNIKGTITNVPGGYVNSASFYGTVTPTQMDINYTLNITGGVTAHGTVHMVKTA